MGINVDIWYDGISINDIDYLDINFYPSSCEYRGNIYIGNRCVGDYNADDSMDIEEHFKELEINWDEYTGHKSS